MYRPVPTVSTWKKKIECNKYVFSGEGYRSVWIGGLSVFYKEEGNMEIESLMDDVALLLSEGYSVTLRATGYSMYPFLVPSHDSVLLCPAGSFQIGDVVLAYTHRKGYVLHRIYEIRADRILLMGDGNLSQKETCDRNAIYGKAVKIIRKGCEVDCTSRKERFLAKAWMKLLPVRRWLLVACPCRRKWNR